MKTKKNIIFDITGVIFKENKRRMASKIGMKSIFAYVAKHRKNPLSVCFEILKKMSLEEKNTGTPRIMYKTYPMPECIALWQQGKVDNNYVTDSLLTYLEHLDTQNYFASRQEKQLMITMVHTLINTHKTPEIITPIVKTIKIIEKLKKQQKHQLFIISNLAHETFDTLSHLYQDVLDMFDDVIISAQVNLLKPDATMYQHLLEKYSLDPQECVFVDDQQDNTLAAQQLCITSIQFKSSKLLKKKFKQLKII